MGFKDIFSSKKKSAPTLDAPPMPPSDMSTKKEQTPNQMPDMPADMPSAPDQMSSPSQDLPTMPDLSQEVSSGLEMPELPTLEEPAPMSADGTEAVPGMPPLPSEMGQPAMPEPTPMTEEAEPAQPIPSEPMQAPQLEDMPSLPPLEAQAPEEHPLPELAPQHEDIPSVEEPHQDAAEAFTDLPELEQTNFENLASSSEPLTTRTPQEGPLYITVDKFRVIKEHIDYMQDDIRECEAHNDTIHEQLKSMGDESYDHFQNSLLSMQRKLMQIDQVLFER